MNYPIIYAATDISIFHWVLYLLSVGGLLAGLLKVHRTLRSLCLPRTQSVLIAFGTLTYLSLLIPGIVGLLTPLWTTVTTLALVSALYLVLYCLRTSIKIHAGHNQEDPLPAIGDTWTIASILLAASGTIAATGFTVYFGYFLQLGLFNPGTRGLAWDTVSYHLPGIVEFFQNRSLWSMEGPYLFYAFGFDLIGAFFSHFFYNYWGLHIANCYAVIFFLVSIHHVLTEFLRSINNDSLLKKRMVVFLLSVGLWCIVLGSTIEYNVGKNDIFTTASLLASFAMILQSSRSKEQMCRWLLLGLASISYGLALATKPNMIGYAPLLPLLTLMLLRSIGVSWGRSLGPSFLFLLVASGLGGFFYVRNLFYYGQLTNPTFHDPGIAASPWQLSMLANLENPALYEINPGGIIFLLALLTLPISSIFWFKACHSTTRSKRIMAVFLFHLASCLIFAITPHAVFHGSLQNTTWELRLGMPLITMSAIMLAVLLVQLLSLTENLISRQPAIGPTLIAAGSLAIAWIVPLKWMDKPQGLPRFEYTDQNHQGIYHWIQQFDQPQHIYSAGLRPYGLYGSRWQNRVFYDLHPTVLEPDGAGKRRLMAILRQFKPQLILISIEMDPTYRGPLVKPLEQWMLQQSCFQLVYRDPMVSAFRVFNGCGQLIKEHVDTLPEKIDMSG